METATRPCERLLIVEDDPEFGPVLERMIKARLKGAATVLAVTLADGLDHLAREGADLVLLDLGLPDSRGLSALAEIRAAGNDPAVIILTGRHDDELARKAMRMGAQDYLLKGSLNIESLVKAIRYAQDRKTWQATLLEVETRRLTSERLLASTLDSMKAAIAIADERGLLVAANAAWKNPAAVLRPFIPPWSEGQCDYATFCQAQALRGGAEASVALGFLKVLSGSDERFVQDFRGGDAPGAQGLGVTIHRLLVEGEPHFSIALADISYRVQKDLELQNAMAIKDLILENSTLGIAFIKQRTFQWANSRVAEMLGRPLDQVLGSPTRFIYPDDGSFEEMGSKTYPALQQDERADITWQLQRADGSLFWCRLIGKPLDPAAPQEGSVWLMEDITERINAEQARLALEVQLRQAQKLEAIGQLAAGIAHEINTPTQYIGDNTTFLRGAFKDVFQCLDTLEEAAAGALDPGTLARIKEDADLAFLRDEVPKAIDQSLDGIDRVSKIVRAMKDFSHPGSDVPIEVDLNRSIESTITVSRNEWKYVADLVLELDPDLGPVHCYPNEINQVVLNLVVNAAHAIADALQGRPQAKGTITVSTRRAGDHAEIRVRDTGTGIPEQVRPKIFDPFFTTKGVGRGTGQGLAIVHNAVVERHRGTVAFETVMGEGTVFILRLPYAPSTAH